MPIRRSVDADQPLDSGEELVLAALEWEMLVDFAGNLACMRDPLFANRDPDEFRPAGRAARLPLRRITQLLRKVPVAEDQLGR